MVTLRDVAARCFDPNTGQPDPIRFGRMLWPHFKFYDKQIEVIRSIRDSVETYAVAGNKLGKDFVGGFVGVTFFVAPWLYFPRSYVSQIEAQRVNAMSPHTRRIVSTSVEEKHLDILFGEAAKFLFTSKVPLLGTEVVMVHQELRLKSEEHLVGKNSGSYWKGRVFAPGQSESLSGHHAPYNLAMGDEASALADEVKKRFAEWAKRRFYFGNPKPCDAFFKTNCLAGDLRVEGAAA